MTALNVCKPSVRRQSAEMKEMHGKPKLSMLKLIAEYEIKSSCLLWKSKGDRRMMLKLRGVTVHLFPDGDWKMTWGEEGVEGVSRSVTVGRLRMCTISYCSALHAITSDGVFWKMNRIILSKRRHFKNEWMEREREHSLRVSTCL